MGKNQKEKPMRQTGHLTQILRFQYWWYPGIQHPTWCIYSSNNRKENLLQVKGASTFHELKFLTSWSKRMQWPCLSQLTLTLFWAKTRWQTLWHFLPQDAQQITVFSVLPPSAIDGGKSTVTQNCRGDRAPLPSLCTPHTLSLLLSTTCGAWQHARSWETAAFPSWNDESGDS